MAAEERPRTPMIAIHMEEELDNREKEKFDTEDAQPLTLTLEILPIIKDAQGQHGLRHGDYQRYRQYCQRRLRRLYKTMHFQHGTRHAFKPKKVTGELLKDVKYLHIPLMDAERAWSHAMELKLMANTELRKKFHYIRRLRKAASHAGELEKLCHMEICDARTKLEAQAYASYMKGSVSFELQNWKEAFELFGQARTIYEKLAGAFSEEQRNMYIQRVEEITPNIRYCAYNLDEGDTDISDLMQLRWSASGGTHDPVLTAKIDEVISQNRDKEAAAMTEISWRGRTVPVKNEKVRSFILHAQQSARELDRADTLESKLTLYDNLLMECKDALQAIKDELKADAGSGKTRSQKTETQVANMQFLHTYVTFIRLSKTVERNLLMAESMRNSLPTSLLNSVNETASEANPGKKMTKPEDLIRIYDIILQNLSDMAELPGIEEDLTLSQEIAAQSLEYKAYRCLFVAHSYLLAKKWGEAASLYNRVLTHASSAITHFQEIGSLQAQQAIGSLQELSSQTRGFKCSAHASFILEKEVVADEMADMSLNEKPLSDRLDLYFNDDSLASKKPQVTAFPPDFQPVPCKPLFFDLALNQLEFPSLAGRVEVKRAGGLAGYFKGWLWGSGS